MPATQQQMAAFFPINGLVTQKIKIFKGLEHVLHDSLDTYVEGDVFLKFMEQTKCILIVDDEPNACAYLKDLLEYFGHETALALTCREAIAALKQRAYDCVLLDMYMGSESGDVVLRWLRSLGRTDPVLMMCSMPHYEMRIELIFKGASDLLGKPVQPTQLRQVLNKILNQPQAVRFGEGSDFPRHAEHASS